MNIVSALIAISIMSTGILTALGTIQNTFLANTTSQVKTDIDTYVVNYRATPTSFECVSLSGFCYDHDAVAADGKTYMVFKIDKDVFGPKVILRLKPLQGPCQQGNYHDDNHPCNNN